MCNEICLGLRRETRKKKVELNFRWYFAQTWIPLGSLEDCSQWPRPEEAKWNLSLNLCCEWQELTPQTRSRCLADSGTTWSIPWQRRKPEFWAIMPYSYSLALQTLVYPIRLQHSSVKVQKNIWAKQHSSINNSTLLDFLISLHISDVAQLSSTSYCGFIVVTPFIVNNNLSFKW